MQIALLGAGQLGGSLALALKETGAPTHITAYDPVRSHSEQLLAHGAVDRIAESAVDAVGGAEIVIFAMPLSHYHATAEAISPALVPHTIVTDVGSVKQTMLALGSLLPSARIVGGHPITGSEKSGPEVARGDLFRGKLCVLTPDDHTDPEALKIVETLWHSVGADVMPMPAQVHDQVYAYVSHLPHFISFLAAGYFHRIGVSVTADDKILAHFLRISRSNARMWTDIALENRLFLLPLLATYRALLEHFATELRAGEQTPAEDAVAVAKAFLPRILAASFISTLSLYEQQAGMQLRAFSGGGMQAIIAPAAQAPESDMAAISDIASTLADHLDAVVSLFQHLEALMGAEDCAALFQHLETLVTEAHQLITPRN